MEYILKTPLSEDDVRKLVIGDIVYLTGIVVTARDQAHKRILELLRNNQKPPIDLTGLAIYHCGPVVRKENGEWRVIAAGPTTSTRMEHLEPDFIKKTGVRMIIGKGGMGENTAHACREYGAVYTVFTGGAALVAAKAIKRVREVYWLDLGIPEALWVFEVEKFGPLVVTIDSRGQNLYEDVMERARRKYEEIISSI